MRVKVTMNNAAVRKLQQAQIIAIEQTADAVKTDVIAKNVMPFDVGIMQDDSTTIDTTKSKQGKVSISTDTPYARRLYFHPEYNFNRDENPNAKGRWFDDWIDGQHRGFAIKAFKKIYKRLTGV